MRAERIEQISVRLYDTLNMFTFVQFMQRLFIYFAMVRLFYGPCEYVSVCMSVKMPF